MKKFLTAGLIGLAFSVSACGGSSGGSHDNTTTTHHLSNDDAFVQTIHGQMSTGTISDSELINLGHNICSAFDQGASPVDIVQVAINSGISAYNAGYLMGASIAAYCPNHSNLIPGGSSS